MTPEYKARRAAEQLGLTLGEPNRCLFELDFADSIGRLHLSDTSQSPAQRPVLPDAPSDRPDWGF
jgi:hypothetical protein